MENKHFTTFDYKKFTRNTLDVKITQKKLDNEYDSNENIKKLATKEEIKTLATNTESKGEQDKLVNLQTYDLILFIDQSYYVVDGKQNYLVLQLIQKIIATITKFSGLPDNPRMEI